MSTLDELPCAELSEALGEDMGGSAPAEPRVLVVEQPGPWGRDAVADSGLEPVAGELAARARAAGARIQVVRRTTRRYDMVRRAVWVADLRPGSRGLRRFDLPADPGALLELDLDDAGAGVAHDDPLFLVCTHSTRDPCCARRGLPLHRAICLTGADAWHASHLGGHRFAATMACLPLGAWLGRVPAEAAPDVVAACRSGRLPLPYLRGRAGETPAVQAAEIAVRRHAGIDAADALTVAPADGDVVRFATAAGDAYVAEVHRDATAQVRPLSCGAGAKTEDPGRYTVTLRP